MNERKTIGLFFIAVFSALFLMSGAVYAGEEKVYEIREGSITVTADSADGSRHKVRQGDRAEETVKGILVISGNKVESTNTITVVAGEGKKADIVIRDVNIVVNKIENTAAFKTEGDIDVDIELDGENKLESGKHCAGIQKGNSGVLTIKDENGEKGTVTAIGGNNGAGIGGGDGVSGNHITITGGTVTAKGGERGAGIGGGEEGSGDYITITGGTVTAKAGKGAGIGGGENGSGNHITITGGIVTAKAGKKGAGIGGGENGSGNHITITGGNVTSQGTGGGAGIGGGEKGSGDYIMITGGTVTAKCSGDGPGAGIGGGENGSGNHITITGGNVTAIGGAKFDKNGIAKNCGAGIGAGSGGKASDIIISGWATVTAASYNNNKMISGYKPSNYDFSKLYTTGSITTYHYTMMINGDVQKNRKSNKNGSKTPPKSKVSFQSDPKEAVQNLPSDNGLHDAGSTIRLSALDFDEDRYRLIGLSISSGTGILTGNQTDGYSLVVGEPEEGKDSVVVKARFIQFFDVVKEDKLEAAFEAKHHVAVYYGTGGGEYEEGDTVTISANDPPEGKAFDKWTSEDGVEFADEASPETTFVMPGHDVTVTATYKERKEEDKPEPRKLVDKVPPIGDERYPSPDDNFAPVPIGNKITKMHLDFSRVKESDVKPDALKMTVIKGTKLATASKVAEGGQVQSDGGIKVKVNKKGIAAITCKGTGSATLPMEDGVTYTVSFTVDKPKAKKLTIPVGSGRAIKTIRELFDTGIDSGTLTATPKKSASKATVSADNTLVIDPDGPDTIKVQYQYLNKKYKTSIKVK